MKIVFSKALYKEMEKAFGKKDLSKLRKEVITDKNGHRKTVYKKIDKQESHGGEASAEHTEGKAHSYAHTRGDRIVFEQGGKNLTGQITDIGKDGVTVKGTGKAKGQIFRVRHENVRHVTKMINPNDAIRGLMDANSVKPGWRNTDGMQPESCDTLEGLYETIGAAREDFNKFTDSVVNEFAALNPIVMKRSSLKSEKRIKEKLREDEAAIKEGCAKTGTKYEPRGYDEKTDTYHCRTIRDCDGHTICLNSIEEVANVLKYLNGRKEIARIKNNFGKPSPVGYSDINCNVKLPNGAIVELQVNTTANMVAKERYGHALYEVYRSVVSNQKYTRLADIMAKAQTDLYGLSNKYSKNGNFPINDIPKGKDGNSNIFDSEYKHVPYAAAIRESVNSAIPLYNQAKTDGVLNDETIKHFEHLIDYIR